jgi:hypothetical protein
MTLIKRGCRFAVVLLGTAGCALSYYAIPAPWGIAPRIAWVCSILALMLIFASLFVQAGPIAKSSHAGKQLLLLDLPHAAFFLGVIAGIIQIVLLTMRGVYVSIDLLHGYAWQGVRDFGFGQTGLWTILALSGACAIGWLSTRNSTLLTVEFWIIVLLATWACLLGDPFQATSTGGFERTDVTLILVECLAGLILLTVLVTGWFTKSQPAGCVEEFKLSPGGLSGSTGVPHGMRASVAALALALNVAIMFHVLVPAGQSNSILRISGIRAGLAALVAATGCALLLRRNWGAHLADATLGLFAMGLCGLATLYVPAQAIPLDHRYPMIFNAIMIGYAVASGVFAQFGWLWDGADHDAHSTRKRLVPHLKRFSFFCAATALLAGVMMCFWPGVPGVSTMDHSFGRILSGFAAFLFLLLVALRNTRLVGRLSFRFLTVAVAASTVAFLAVRAIPFASGASR